MQTYKTRVSIIGPKKQCDYFISMVTHPGNVIEGKDNLYIFEYTHKDPDAILYVYDPLDESTYRSIPNNVDVVAGYYDIHQPIVNIPLPIENISMVWCEECWIAMQYIVEKVHSIQSESLIEIVYGYYNG